MGTSQTELFKQDALQCMRGSLAQQNYPGYPNQSERLHGDVTNLDIPDQWPLHPWITDMLDDPEIGAVTGRRFYRNFGANYTADPIIVRRDMSKPHVLLIERGDTGCLALPGGFIEPDEDPATAARREAKEETGIDLLRLIHTIKPVYSGPVADIRLTANAWPETFAFCFELQLDTNEEQKTLTEMMSRNRFDKVIRSAGRAASINYLQNRGWQGTDDAKTAGWFPADKVNNRLFGSHKALVELAMKG